MTTSDQLEVSKQAYCGTAFEGGVNQDHEGTGPGDHWMAKLDLIESHVPLGPHLSTRFPTPEIPSVLGVGSTVAV